MSHIGALEAGRVKPLTARGEATRDALIAATLAEIAELGYAGARVEQITARAGVGYGTFYKYFASKSDLVRTVMKEIYEDVFEHATSETQSSRPVSERVFLDLLASLRSFARHRETLIALDSAVGADPELAAHLATLQEHDVLEYAEILRTTPGYAPVADPYLVSLAVNSLGDEVARRWMRSAMFTGSDEQAVEIAQIITAMCLAVVANPQPAPPA
ncbi:MAG: TetR/AcrR family transcriptional regulator [Chloroflexi bacterium]|nr:TetR/AcrR family transcriptional regulator [Chloroflexota bacterium]